MSFYKERTVICEGLCPADAKDSGDFLPRRTNILDTIADFNKAGIHTFGGDELIQGL